MDKKTLKISMSYMVAGDVFIEVPANWSLEQASKYAADHIQDLELPSHPEYICDSADVDEETAEFVDHFPQN